MTPSLIFSHLDFLFKNCHCTTSNTHWKSCACITLSTGLLFAGCCRRLYVLIPKMLVQTGSIHISDPPELADLEKFILLYINLLLLIFTCETLCSSYIKPLLGSLKCHFLFWIMALPMLFPLTGTSFISSSTFSTFIWLMFTYSSPLSLQITSSKRLSLSSLNIIQWVKCHDNSHFIFTMIF
jgi:hypothetical protein